MTDTAAAKPYRVLSDLHENRWDPQLQQVVPGTAVKALWLATGSVISVFVPDTADLPSTADTLIRAQGAQLDALHAE